MARKTWMELFWERVDKRGEDECWFWKGKLTPNGYGYCKANHKTQSCARHLL